MKGIRIYTDGGCRNTGNKKGQHVKINNKSAYAFLITKDGKKLYAHTHGYYGKTNNQMEVAGALQALRYAKALGINRRPITLVSDSKYVDDTINKHRLGKWHYYHFQYKGKLKPNAHLWSMMYNTLKRYPNIKFQWTKGHANGRTQDSRGNIFVDHTLNHTMDRLPTISVNQAKDLNHKQHSQSRRALRHKQSNFYSYRSKRTSYNQKPYQKKPNIVHPNKDKRQQEMQQDSHSRTM